MIRQRFTSEEISVLEDAVSYYSMCESPGDFGGGEPDEEQRRHYAVTLQLLEKLAAMRAEEDRLEQSAPYSQYGSWVI